jgi:molybdopterin molybdotransferase
VLVEQHAGELLRIHESQQESVSLLAARMRVLAENITADRDLPPFARSARDGYAVRSGDIAAIPAKLKVIAEIRAGSPILQIALKKGEAVEIMTGAPAPAGADAVVMVEYTHRSGDVVELIREVRPGENIVPRGEEAKTGEVLLRSGTRIGHAHIAVAAAMGRETLQVFERPKIAVLATGDEVVELGSVLGPHQIRNSNTYSLAAQVEAAGGQPVLLPVAPDESGALRALLERGLGYDLLLISGGVSMGKHDLVEQVLAELGAEFFFIGAKIQPGKPVVFGRAKGKYFFGLPGNPISTMVTFELFAKPLVQALGGAPPSPLVLLKTKVGKGFTAKPGLTRFLPARVNADGVEPVGWKGSGDIASAARANCYIVTSEAGGEFKSGEMVNILPMNR